MTVNLKYACSTEIKTKEPIQVYCFFNFSFTFLLFREAQLIFISSFKLPSSRNNEP